MNEIRNEKKIIFKVLSLVLSINVKYELFAEN